MLKLGSHVGMNGKEMLLGSAKEAVSYGDAPALKDCCSLPPLLTRHIQQLPQL